MSYEIEIRRQLVATIEGLTMQNNTFRNEVEKEKEKNIFLEAKVKESKELIKLFIHTSTGQIRQRLQEVQKTLDF